MLKKSGIPVSAVDKKGKASYKDIGEDHQIFDAAVHTFSDFLVFATFQNGPAHCTLGFHRHRNQ